MLAAAVYYTPPYAILWHIMVMKNRFSATEWTKLCLLNPGTIEEAKPHIVNLLRDGSTLQYTLRSIHRRPFAVRYVKYERIARQIIYKRLIILLWRSN